MAKLIITTLLQVFLINLLSSVGNWEINKKETVNSVLQESSIKPAKIFQSNMVIQQEMPVKILGTALEGTRIIVSLSHFLSRLGFAYLQKHAPFGLH
jgi:hypothetical protein